MLAGFVFDSSEEDAAGTELEDMFSAASAAATDASRMALRLAPNANFSFAPLSLKILPAMVTDLPFDAWPQRQFSFAGQRLRSPPQIISKCVIRPEMNSLAANHKCGRLWTRRQQKIYKIRCQSHQAKLELSRPRMF